MGQRMGTGCLPKSKNRIFTTFTNYIAHVSLIHPPFQRSPAQVQGTAGKAAGRFLPLYHFVQQQFGRLMGRYADRIDRYGDNPGEQVETVVMKAVEYIRQHYTNPDLTMAVIAEAVNLSPDGLAKAFLRENFRATRFINLLRVHHGEDLLRDTDLPVGDVAFLSGFRDRSRFFGAFQAKIRGQSAGVS